METLLKSGASTSIRTAEGVDVASFEDVPADILALIQQAATTAGEKSATK